MLNELIETVSCPLCGQGRYTVLKPAAYPDGLSKENVVTLYSASSDHMLFDQMVRCDECSLVYLNPRIKKEFIIESYSRAVDPTFIKQNPYRIKTFKRTLQSIVSRYSLDPVGCKSILDIGCAGGAFPKAASEIGFKVTGIEPSRWLSEQARNLYGLDIRTGILEEQHFAPQSFDVITIWDVIEHLTDPGYVLNEIHNLLANDGILVVNYPDYTSLARRLLGYKWPFFLSVHLIYFTPETITGLLNKHRFEVIEMHPYWQTLELGYALQRARNILSYFAPVEKLVHLIKLSDLPFTYNMGQSLIVARKK